MILLQYDLAETPSGTQVYFVLRDPASEVLPELIKASEKVGLERMITNDGDNGID